MNEIIEQWLKYRENQPLQVQFPYMNLVLDHSGYNEKEKEKFLSELTPEKYKKLLELLGEI